MPQLFALQTQPTPENSLVYANVFDQIVNDTGVQAAIYACDVGSFGACSDLEDDIRKALGFPFSPYPTNLQALGEDGNNVILQNITSWITDTWLTISSRCTRPPDPAEPLSSLIS